VAPNVRGSASKRHIADLSERLASGFAMVTMLAHVRAISAIALIPGQDSADSEVRRAFLTRSGHLVGKAVIHPHGCCHGAYPKTMFWVGDAIDDDVRSRPSREIEFHLCARHHLETWRDSQPAALRSAWRRTPAVRAVTPLRPNRSSHSVSVVLAKRCGRFSPRAHWLTRLVVTMK